MNCPFAPLGCRGGHQQELLRDLPRIPIISYLTNDEILASQEVADRINEWVATWQQENRENNVIYLGLYSDISK